MRKAFFLLVLLPLLLNSCRQPTRLIPRMLDGSARGVLEYASLAVLGKAKNIRALGNSGGVHGWTEMRANVEVIEILKGTYGKGEVCVRFAYFKGDFHGPDWNWFEGGSPVILFLVPDGDCYRTVSDGQVAIPAVAMHKEGNMSLEDFIAQATNPVQTLRCRERDIQSSQGVVTSVMIPFVGARRTRQLLVMATKRPDAHERACACVLLCVSWGVEDGCLEGVPFGLFPHTEGMREGAQRKRSQELQALQTRPLEWLKETVMTSGLDGALLMLSILKNEGKGAVPDSTCRLYRTALEEGALDEVLLAGAKWSVPKAEADARHDFARWTRTGCVEGLLD